MDFTIPAELQGLVARARRRRIGSGPREGAA